VADSLLSTDLAAVSGLAGTEAATREPTPDTRDHQRKRRTSAREKNKAIEVPVEEQPLESPGHEIDSFA
jgi:hypothetical protein